MNQNEELAEIVEYLPPSRGSLEVSCMRYYVMYDMVGSLDACWYLDRPRQIVECVIRDQSYERISVFLGP